MENKKDDKMSWGMILGIGLAVWFTGALVFNGLDLFRDGKAMQGFAAFALAGFGIYFLVGVRKNFE